MQLNPLILYCATTSGSGTESLSRVLCSALYSRDKLQFRRHPLTGVTDVVLYLMTEERLASPSKRNL